MPNIKNKYYNAVCCLYHKTYQYKHEKKKKSKYLLFAAVLHTAMKDAVVSPDTQMENNSQTILLQDSANYYLSEFCLSALRS